MTYCPHCNEYIVDAWIDWSYSDDTFSSLDENSSEDQMEDNFGHVPISRGLKRTRAEANLGDMQDTRSLKKTRTSLGPGSHAMNVD